MKTAYPNQVVTFDVVVRGAGGAIIAATLSNATLTIGDGDPLTATVSGQSMSATVPADVALGATTFAWAWTQLANGVTSQQSLTENVGIVAPGEGQVNTTAREPAPAGTYSPDGDFPGMYCSLQDAAKASIGINWKAIQLYITEYDAMLYEDAPDVPSLLTKYIIPEAEARADVYMRQTYKPTQVTRYFSGDGSTSLLLPNAPVISLNECKIFAIPAQIYADLTHPRYVQGLGSQDDVTQYQDADLLVNPETGLLIIPPNVLISMQSAIPLWNFRFMVGEANVKVVWTYGFADAASVPSAIKQATAEYCAIIGLEWLGAIEMHGLSVIKTGGTQRIVTRETNLPYSDLINAKQKRAELLLRNWRAM